MDWDFGGVDMEQPAQGTRLDRELVPEGTHTFSINSVSDTPTHFEVVLAHSEPRYGWVWVKLPKGQEWAQRIGASLAAALGLSPAEWKATEIGSLVGRWVNCEVYHKAGNSGRTFVNARKFHAPPAEIPAARAKPAPRPAAKAIPDDSIPF